jgi:hypothetical protein
VSFLQLERLEVIQASRLLAHPPTPRRHLLSPWLREREAVMLFAATGVGKSQVAMSLALAVAGGQSAFGWHASEPRPVLYVDGEMDREDLADRIRDLRRAIGAEGCEVSLENLHLLARDTCRPGVSFPDLGTDEGHEVVLAFAQQVGAALVILDNLSTLATVEDENSASAIKKPTELVQKLRQAGCATILVHHSDKSGSTYRGSSNLATTFAWVIGLHKPKDSDSIGMDATIQWHKTRGLTDESMTPRRLRLAPNRDGAAVWEVTEPEDLQTIRLARAIRSRQFINLTEAGESIGLAKSRTYEVARRLPLDASLDDRERDGHFKAARELRRAEAAGTQVEDF